MEKSVFAVSLVLQCLLVFCLPQTAVASPANIDEVIDDNTFYPLLNESQGLSPLVFGLIMSFGGYFDSSGAVPGVRVALDRINNDTSLLPGYSLHYALSDSKCTTQGAVTALFKQLPYSEPKRIALIGGGCSVASESIADISHHFNVMQISCATTTPVLSNRKRFPKYFQLLPSMIEFAPTYLGIIKEFNWRHVVIFLQDENLFTMTVERLKKLLVKENITYSIDLFDSRTGVESLNREPFADPDERIYIIVSYASYARQLLCEAYHRNIRYPTHLLLTFQWYSPQWWLVEDQNYTCTGEQRGEVLHMTLSVNIFDTLSDFDKENHINSMNITEEEFNREQRRHLHQPPFYFKQSISALFCHDATWALAWSLNKTIGESNWNRNVNVIDVGYMSESVTMKIVQHMNNTFSGLTGTVNLDRNGIREPNNFNVFQHTINFSSVKGNIITRQIGSVVFDDVQYYLHYVMAENLYTVWPSKLVPYDGVPMEVVDNVSIPLMVIVILLSATGVVFASVCMIFNIMFRKKRIMQISRPKLNYFVILGAHLFYIGMIVVVIPTTDASIFNGLTNARAWFLSLAFSFCYGAIIMKMFRVYYILHNPQPNKNIRDWVLMLGIFIFAIIDIIILVSNIIIAGILKQNNISLAPNKDNPRTLSGERQVSTDHMIYTYESLVYKVSFGLLYCYKLILQLFALLLALCTNDVKVQGLDDAKSIITAVYITTINLIIVIMTYYAYRDYLNTYTALLTLSTYVSTNLILGLVFIPKMIALYKDPKGEKVFDKYETPSLKSQLQLTQQQQHTDSATETVDSLKQRIRELENIVTENQAEHNSENGPSIL